MKEKDRCSVLCAVLIVALEVLGGWTAIPVYGKSFFLYYTHISNVILGIASLLWISFMIRRLRDGIVPPVWVRVLKYVATCMMVLTLVVVAAVLGPAREVYFSVFLDGSFLYFHTICPLLALISMLAFEGRPLLKPCHVYLTLIPTVLYGAVMFILNLLDVYEGPYPFFLVYQNPVWLTILYAVLLLLGSWGIAAAIQSINTKAHQEYIY